MIKRVKRTNDREVGERTKRKPVDRRREPLSEIAQIKQQIALEYLAAKWGLSGLAYGTARHPQITARMERMGASFTQLTHVVGSPEQAAQILADVMKDLPEQATRSHLLEVLRHELG